MWLSNVFAALLNMFRSNKQGAQFNATGAPSPNAPAPRHTYEQSCAKLQLLGYLESNEFPPIPSQRPRHDDSGPPGVSFFRTEVTGELSNLTLLRTFFGKSEIREASFRNTDLTESTLCWCDFEDMDFSDACLRDSDLRAANFDRVNFSRCDLRGSDLRLAHFNNCVFEGAVVKGMKLTRAQARQVRLDKSQAQDVDWQSSDGDEPEGA
jgi:uncharacterized protein YjbI with pentapeptide repeats